MGKSVPLDIDKGGRGRMPAPGLLILVDGCAILIKDESPSVVRSVVNFVTNTEAAEKADEE